MFQAPCFLHATLVVALLVGIAAAAQVELVLEDGTVVARVPVSPGRHAGQSVGHEAPAAEPDEPRSNGGKAGLVWVHQKMDSVGQSTCLRDVHMAPLMANAVFVVGEGGVVLKVPTPNVSASRKTLMQPSQ